MSDDEAGAVGAAVLFGFACFAGLIGWAIRGFIYGKIFEKAGRPLWVGWVPIYSTLVHLEIVGRPWWFLLLLFVPGANLVVTILLALDLAKAFGKDELYGIGLVVPLVNVVLILMLAFGDARYLGPVNKPA